MFAGIELNSAAEALLAEQKKRELEFRYEPRAGPEILPEPRVEVESLFDYDWEGEFDRSKSLLLTATDDIEKKTISFLEHAEEYIKESCEDGKNVIFGKIRDEEKKEKIQSWLELIVETVHKNFKSKSLEHLDDINKYTSEILDHLITSAQNSISLHKSKLDEKVLTSREAIALYQTSRDRYMKFAQSEAVRIAINETEDRVGAQMVELEEQVETSLHTQKLLIRQVETLGSQIATKDQEINLLKSKIAEFEAEARENAFNPFASSTTATSATLHTLKETRVITDKIVESSTPNLSSDNNLTQQSPSNTNKSTTKVTVGKITIQDHIPKTVDKGVQTIPETTPVSNNSANTSSSPELKTTPASPGRGDMKWERGKGWQSSAPSPEREHSSSFDIDDFSLKPDCKECEKLKLEIKSLGSLLSAQQVAISNSSPIATSKMASTSTTNFAATTTDVVEEKEMIVKQIQPDVAVKDNTKVEVEEVEEEEVKDNVLGEVVVVEERVETKMDSVEEVVREEPSIANVPNLSIEGTDGNSIITEEVCNDINTHAVSTAPIVDIGTATNVVLESNATSASGMVYSDSVLVPVEVKVDDGADSHSHADTVNITPVSDTMDTIDKTSSGDTVADEIKEVSDVKEPSTNKVDALPPTENIIFDPKVIEANTIDSEPTLDQTFSVVKDLVETQPDVQDIVEVDVIVSEETKSSLAPEVNTTTNAEDNISIASIATEDSMRIIPTKENELSVLDTDHGPILLSQEEGGLNTSINLDTGSSVIEGGKMMEMDVMRKMTESPPSGDIQSQYMNAINDSNMSMYNNIRRADQEAYVRTIAAMQDYNSRLTTNVKALEAKLDKERVVTSLKLKERSMLLKELVSQVNDLRAELATSRLAHAQIKKSTVHIKGPRAESPTRPPTVMARLDSGNNNSNQRQSNQQQMMSPITSSLSPVRPGSSFSTKNQYGTDGMNVEAAERPMTTSTSLPFLRNSTFSASGGRYGAVVNPLPLSNSYDATTSNVTPSSIPNSADKKSNYKKQVNLNRNSLSNNQIGSGGLDGLPPRVKTPLRLPRTMQAVSIEEGQLDLNWLGAEQSTHDEISRIREKLLQHLAESSAKDALKKEIRLATTANKDLKQAGREIRLKEWREKQAALYAIGKKVIDKHKPKKQKEYW